MAFVIASFRIRPRGTDWEISRTISAIFNWKRMSLALAIIYNAADSLLTAQLTERKRTV
jgi:hypothetical protein